MWGLPRPGRRGRPHSPFQTIVLVPTGAAESSRALRGPRHLGLTQLERDTPSEHDLRDPLAVHDAPRRGRVIAHDDEPLLCVIRIDRSGRIRDGERVLECLATARPDLSLDVGWEPRSESERD